MPSICSCRPPVTLVNELFPGSGKQFECHLNRIGDDGKIRPLALTNAVIDAVEAKAAIKLPLIGPAYKTDRHGDCVHVALDTQIARHLELAGAQTFDRDGFEVRDGEMRGVEPRLARDFLVSFGSTGINSR